MSIVNYCAFRFGHERKILTEVLCIFLCNFQFYDLRTRIYCFRNFQFIYAVNVI
jgi:hypothetical protein